MKQTELEKQPRLCVLIYYCIAHLNTYNLYKKLRIDQWQYIPLIVALVSCRAYSVTSKTSRTTERRRALKNKTTTKIPAIEFCAQNLQHWQVKKIISLEPLVLSLRQFCETHVPVRYFVSKQTKRYKQKTKVVVSSEMAQRLGKWLLCQRSWVQFPAATWYLTVIHETVPRGPSTIFWLQQVSGTELLHRHIGKIAICIEF